MKTIITTTILSLILFNISNAQVKKVKAERSDEYIEVNYKLKNRKASKYEIKLAFEYKAKGENKFRLINPSKSSLFGDVNTVNASKNSVNKTITWNVYDDPTYGSSLLVGELKPVIYYVYQAPTRKKMQSSNSIVKQTRPQRQSKIKSPKNRFKYSSSGFYSGVGASYFRFDDKHIRSGWSSHINVNIRITKNDKTYWSFEPGLRTHRQKYTEEYTMMNPGDTVSWRYNRRFSFVELPIEFNIGDVWNRERGVRIGGGWYIGIGGFVAYMIGGGEKGTRKEGATNWQNLGEVSFFENPHYKLNRLQFGASASVNLAVLKVAFRFHPFPLYKDPYSLVSTTESLDVAMNESYSPKTSFSITMSFLLDFTSYIRL